MLTAALFGELCDLLRKVFLALCKAFALFKADKAENLNGTAELLLATFATCWLTVILFSFTNACSIRQFS